MAAIGSLFDGSGGFPLAASLCGIEPIWASEVEPYPIAVTRSRFPKMKHIGDVSKVNGADIAPVDVLSFGFPCQDVSVAGAGRGVKHEDNGDEEATRSGLYFEALRIIKEMREKTNGQKPTFAVFENVPGLFSNEGGRTLQTVIEELIKIVEPSAVMPPIPKGGWAYADSYIGDGWSFAYRIFDAQYIRTAQRRRRVYAVLDLRGERAAEILFKRESLRGNPQTCGKTRQTASADAQGCSLADDREGASGFPLGFRPENVRCYDETATTLCNGTRAGFTTGVIIKREASGLDVYNQTLTGDKTMTVTGAATDPHHIPCTVYDARGNGGGKTVNTITGDHENRITDYTSVVIEEKVIALDRASFNQGENAKYDFEISDSGVNSTIVAKGPGAVCYSIGNGQVHDACSPSREVSKTLNCLVDPMKIMIAQKPQYIVRRLTPTECARLQGFPDKWGHIIPKEDFTDEEYKFWLNVRNTHAKINGKVVKDYTKAQMLKWYNKLHTDSAEYKMWGNGIALPCALYVMEGIEDALKEEKEI